MILFFLIQLTCKSNVNPNGDLITTWENDQYDPSNGGKLFIVFYSTTPLLSNNNIVFEYYPQYENQVSEFAVFTSLLDLDLNDHFFHNVELKNIYDQIGEIIPALTNGTEIECDPPSPDDPKSFATRRDEIIVDIWDCEDACGEVNECIQEVLDEVINYINTQSFSATVGTYLIPGSTECFSQIEINTEFDQNHTLTWSVTAHEVPDGNGHKDLIFRFFTEDGLVPNLLFEDSNEEFEYNFDIIAQAFTNTRYNILDETVKHNGSVDPPIKFLYKTIISSGTNCETFFQTGYFTLNDKLVKEDISSAELCSYTEDLDQLKADCLIELDEYVIELATSLKNEKVNRFIDQIISIDCLDGIEEKFTRTNDDHEYHYTLYYYDQLGNIVQTVPPEGVDRLPPSDFTDGVLNNGKEPEHKKITSYTYNSFNQIVKSNTHDAGLTTFEYDDLQRLRYSQNAQQESEGGDTYSYTNYDHLSRIIEVGEATALQPDINKNNPSYPSTNDPSFTGTLQDRVKTYYSEELETNLDGNSIFDYGISRNRVTASKRINGIGEDNDDTNAESDDNISYYSYDIHGNVKTIQQEIGDLIDPVTIEYDYDLISGNVKELAFNPGAVDQFYHRYTYDADNRIQQSFFSTDRSLWEEQARYFYYLHGPLARVEYGDNKVQGLDYIYTMQGWIKGGNLVEHTNGDYVIEEPGQDGQGSIGDLNQNSWLARDASAYALNYNNNDYNPIGTSLSLDEIKNIPINLNTTNAAGILSDGFFNGNISAMSTQFHENTNISSSANAYQYDQLHRITQSVNFNLNDNAETWSQNATKNQVKLTYDPDGNIEQLERNGGEFPARMDLLTYNYEDDPNNAGNDEFGNRLSSVRDHGPLAGNYENDFDGTTNYTYDAIGNLTNESSSVTGSTDITWDVYNKVRSVDRSLGSTTYTYDPSGNRVSETTSEGTEIQIRDAQGNALAIYQLSDEGLTQTEVHLYGSSRLGKVNTNLLVDGHPKSTTSINYTNRQYELSNHLGNVLTTFTGRKLGVSGDGEYLTHYQPEIATASVWL